MISRLRRDAVFPCPPGEPVVAGSRLPGVSRCPKSRFSCQPRNPVARSCRWRKNSRTACTIGRLRIEHVNSSVKRCRIVKTGSPMEEGVRDR